MKLLTRNLQKWVRGNVNKSGTSRGAVGGTKVLVIVYTCFGYPPDVPNYAIDDAANWSMLVRDA